ncbi:hypothetical protein Q4557_05170 [Shewanella sp. 5_MG-2023]|nr:hypothetical protein [Shewanella sp. 5_MG-2023]MDO6639350.1 hypothetical protein [Shewanella sp. 5_MG-2023]
MFRVHCSLHGIRTATFDTITASCDSSIAITGSNTPSPNYGDTI